MGMSDRIINYYEFEGRETDWAKLRTLFPRNVSKFNVPFFDANFEAEEKFLHHCQASHFGFNRKTIVEYEGQGATCISENGRGFMVIAQEHSGCYSLRIQALPVQAAVH